MAGTLQRCFLLWVSPSTGLNPDVFSSLDSFKDLFFFPCAWCMGEITFHFQRRCKIASRSRFTGREEFSQTKKKSKSRDASCQDDKACFVFCGFFFFVNEFIVVYAGRPVVSLPAGCWNSHIPPGLSHVAQAQRADNSVKEVGRRPVDSPRHWKASLSPFLFFFGLLAASFLNKVLTGPLKCVKMWRLKGGDEPVSNRQVWQRLGVCSFCHGAKFRTL